MGAAARALVTGVTGQDGSYLAELLLAEGATVFGLARDPDPARLAGLSPELAAGLERGALRLVPGDLTDAASLARAVALARPDEVYNLASQSFVAASWRDPVATADVTGLGALRLLEAVRAGAPAARFLQASSAAMFGRSREAPQRETTPFRPKSPYGVAKLFAHWSAVETREAHGLFAATAILFNHESPRRGPEFVTRKITRAAARIRLGLETGLALGDLEPRRDWGHARDYVRALRLILRHDVPDDFVIATGETHSVRECCEIAFEACGLDWRKHVGRDAAFVRPSETELLVGDATKAREELGWRPTVGFRDLVREMVAADLAALGGVSGRS
jgi:GDPmannose 4,6-dehydratase